jgi:hypothetical protein
MLPKILLGVICAEEDTSLTGLDSGCMSKQNRGRE